MNKLYTALSFALAIPLFACGNNASQDESRSNREAVTNPCGKDACYSVNEHACYDDGDAKQDGDAWLGCYAESGRHEWKRVPAVCVYNGNPYRPGLAIGAMKCETDGTRAYWHDTTANAGSEREGASGTDGEGDKTIGDDFTGNTG